MNLAAIPVRKTYQTDVTEECISERRIWLAVITLAIQDWRSGTLRARRDAQTFLFENQADYDLVCSRAGLDPNTLRTQLLRIGRRVEMAGALEHPVAA